MIKAILVTCNIKTRQLTKQHLKKRKHNDNHQQPFGKHLRAECCGAVGETPSPEALQVTVLLMALQWLKKTLDHILFFSPYKKNPKRLLLFPWLILCLLLRESLVTFYAVELRSVCQCGLC